MPEFNLPGISSNIDVKGIIDKLVQVERKKLDRIESSKEQLDKEKSAWINLNSKINELQNASKELYGFRAPFDEKIALSSNEKILTAKASRIALPSKTSIKVEQVAQQERITSDPVDSNKTFEKNLLKFIVGEREIEVNFEGGGIDSLLEAFNSQAGEYITAKITRDTEKTQVLVIEVKKTGESNRIKVSDESTIDFFKKIGLYEEGRGYRIDSRLSAERFVTLDEITRYRFQEGILTLEPKSYLEFILKESVISDENIYLNFKVRYADIKPEKFEEVPIKWPDLKSIGAVTVRDVDIEGGRPISKPREEEVMVKREEPLIIDNTVIGIKSDRGVKRTLEVRDLAGEFRELSFKLTDLIQKGEKVERILFLNNNTGRRIEYRDLVIEDRTLREGLVPKHLVQEGKDSILYIDGVKVQRETNDIGDAIKGVDLHLQKASPEEIVLTVDRDFEKITKKIVEMINSYNGLLTFINEMTNVTPSGNLNEENEVGILSGDINIMGLKNKLQTIMMNPYPTERVKELSLLAQIGISMGRTGTAWSEIRGGYLQVDEDSFIDTFQRYPETVKQLFGSDSNDDMIIDNGVAFVLEKTLKGYSDSKTGVITQRIKNTDTEIKGHERQIKDFNEHLEEYRKKLERDFTIMQQALQELDQNQKSIENFSEQFKK